MKTYKNVVVLYTLYSSTWLLFSEPQATALAKISCGIIIILYNVKQKHCMGVKRAMMYYAHVLDTHELGLYTFFRWKCHVEVCGVQVGPAG